MQLEELIVPLKLNNDSFTNGIEGSITKATAFGTIIGNIATSAISGAFNLLGKGIQTVTGFLEDSVGEAMASQDAIAQLEAVIKSTGGVAGVTSKQAQDLATSLQKVTKFSDEAILSGENMLLTFTSIGKDIFPRATETILDMSQALNQDLKSSAIQLGKALNDPIAGVTALRRVGVQFSDEQEEMIKKMVESGDLMKAQTFILDELQKEFGGSAKAAGETFGGQLEILKNKLSDLKERIGGAILPVLTELANKFSKLIDSPEFQKIIDTLVKSLEGLGNWIITNLPKWQTKFTEFLGSIKTWWESKAKPSLEELRKFLDTAIPVAIEGSKLSWKALTDFWTTNFLPVGNQLHRLWTNIKDILALVGIQIDGNKTAIQGLILYFSPWIAQLKALSDILNIVNRGLDLMNDILEAAKARLNGLNVSAATSAIAKVSNPLIVPRGARASGGPVIAGQSYNVAEFNKPEVFTPNTSGRIDKKENTQVTVSIDYNKLSRLLATELAKVVG